MAMLNRLWQKRRRWRFLAGVLFVLSAGTAWGEKHALLIGVGDYKDEGVKDLAGPGNDVEELQRQLRNWGFTDQHIQVLLDATATRSGILQALQRLSQHTRNGDHVFIYFSGHGTSARDPNNPTLSQLIPDNSGGFLPYDFPASSGDSAAMLDSLIIGRRDLRPVLKQLDESGVEVFVAVDSCYSGNAVRSLHRSLNQPPPLSSRFFRSRAAGNLVFDEDLATDDVFSGTREEDAYPYRNVIFLAAAHDNEEAKDIGERHLKFEQFRTHTNKPHGAFTDALIRALAGDKINADEDRNGLTYRELFEGIKTYMDERYPHTPRFLPGLNQDQISLSTRKVFAFTGQKASLLPDPEKTIKPLHIALDRHYSHLSEHLNRIKGLTVVTTGADIVISAAGSDLLLLTGTGDEIKRYPSPVSLTDVIERLEQAARLHHLLQAAPGHPDYKLHMELRNAGVALPAGTKLDLSIKADHPMQLLLVDYHADGGMTVLYPYDHSELNMIPANQFIRFPGSAFDIVVGEPFGMDQVVAFGFTRPVDLVAKLAGQDLAPDSPLLLELESLLLSGSVTFSRATQKLITVPSP